MAQHDLTDLVTRIDAIGGNLDQLLALDNVEDQRRYGVGVVAWNRKAEYAAYELVEKMEAAARPAPAPAPAAAAGPLATDRQVDYVLSLIARRVRSGEGGGWMSHTGGYPTRDQLATMTRRDISRYIDQLRDSYNY